MNLVSRIFFILRSLPKAMRVMAAAALFMSGSVLIMIWWTHLVSSSLPQLSNVSEYSLNVSQESSHGTGDALFVPGAQTPFESVIQSLRGVTALMPDAREFEKRMNEQASGISGIARVWQKSIQYFSGSMLFSFSYLYDAVDASSTFIAEHAYAYGEGIIINNLN